MTAHNFNYQIRELCVYDIRNAIDLVWEVFEEFEAPEYSEEGIKSFRDFIEYNSILEKYNNNNIFMYGCFDNNELLGIVAVREFKHICLLFVKKIFHNQGIAKNLFKFAIDKCKNISQYPLEITVNSSPYAVGFYHRMDFINTDEEQIVNGIKFIPMKYFI